MDSQLIERVRAILHTHELGTALDIRKATGVPTIGSEATAQTMRVQTDRQVLLVKLAEQELREQTLYHNTIAPHLPLPRLIAWGDGYQVLEWIENAETLLKLVESTEPDVLSWYQKAATHLACLWGANATAGGTTPSGHWEKNRKAEATLKEYFGTAYHLPIVINGEQRSSSVAGLFAATLNAIANPVATIRHTHGDPRFDNMLINPERGVVFIDTRPGFPDWIDDLTLFAWQRGFRIVKFSTTPSLRLGPNVLSINYEAQCPAWTDSFEREALTVAEEFGHRVSDEGWRQRYHYAVAACALREIASIRKRHAIGALGCELHEGAEGFWIGEALRYFQLALQHESQGGGR